MKKLLLSLMAVAALLLSGCDTTETTTIQVALGSDRGTTPPESISTIYIGVYNYTYSEEYGWVVGASVAAVSLPPVGSVTIVVPAKRDLYICVMAMDDDDPSFWFGGTEYWGSDSGGEEEELLSKRADRGPDVVQIWPYQYSMSPSSGETYIEPEDGSGPMDESGIDVTCGLGSTLVFPNEVTSISEFHIDKKINEGSYKLINKAAYEANYVYFDDLTNVNPPAGTYYYYRARLYVPAFGIYFYNWGDDNYYFPFLD